MSDFNLPCSICLEVTELYYLRCKMCFYWGNTGFFTTYKGEEKPKTMDLNLIKRIVKELKPARPNYSLFGGEPLLHPNFGEIVNEIKGSGSSMDTPTNGTLLSKHAEMLIRTVFDSIWISIDGTKEVSDAQQG